MGKKEKSEIRAKEKTVKIPITMDSMSKEQLDIELEKGYRGMFEGRSKSVSVVFDEIRKSITDNNRT